MKGCTTSKFIIDHSAFDILALNLMTVGPPRGCMVLGGVFSSEDGFFG